MLEFSGLNYLAIIVTWLFSIIVGSLWYSPLGFSKQWSKLTGVDMMTIPKQEANRAITLVALSSLLQVLVLAVILKSMHITDPFQGIAAGLLLWAGLTAATTVGTTLYSRKSLRFWILNAGYFLVVMSVNSLVLTLWR